MLVIVGGRFWGIILIIGGIVLLLLVWVWGQGFKGKVFVGAVVSSFYFVLCTLWIFFGVFRSRGEGRLTAVPKRSLLVVSGLC